MRRRRGFFRGWFRLCGWWCFGDDAGFLSKLNHVFWGICYANAGVVNVLYCNHDNFMYNHFYKLDRGPRRE